MKNYLLYGILGLCFLGGCRKEESLVPRENPINYFEIQDQSGRFNHLAYEVYKAHGMPIFVNDTLGREERGTDAYGNPVIYYELFTLDYSITGQLGLAGIVLSSDTTAMVKATGLIRDRVLPSLPKQKINRPYSYLLVDSLYFRDYGWLGKDNSWWDNMQTGYAHNNMMGTVVGKLSEIGTMTDDETDYWVGSVIAVSIVPLMEEHFTSELNAFYAVTTDMVPKSVYKKAYRCNRETLESKDPEYNLACEDLGFLEWSHVGVDYWTPVFLEKRAIDKSYDLRDYVAAVYAYPQDKFENLYAGYPKCIEKYKIMKKLVDRLKAEVDY